jgi:hypothetical protein
LISGADSGEVLRVPGFKVKRTVGVGEHKLDEVFSGLEESRALAGVFG